MRGGRHAKAIRVGVLVLALASLTGCGFYRDVSIGANVVSIDGQIATIGAQAWHVVDSGLANRPTDWRVEWGDGSTSGNADAIRPVGASCANPFGVALWRHEYAVAGTYTVTIWTPGADPV